MRLTKRHKFNAKLVEEHRAYSLAEAIATLKKAQGVKFDPSVELQFSMAVKGGEGGESVRGTVVLPHGTGKKLKVVVLSKDEAGKAAREAGADTVGGSELVDKIAGGWFDFDVVIAAPSMMREVGKLGKILGPRGLMPSPKAGTVTENLADAVREVKRGRIEFKMDKQSNINVMIGKLSFTDEALLENAQALIQAVLGARPGAVKGDFISRAHLSSTMGPGVRLDPGLFRLKEKPTE